MSTLFSNFFKKFQKSSSAPQKRLQIHFFIFGPTRSTLSYSFTLCLVYNGLFSIIISSTLLPKNSPPDCFLYGRLQIPSFSLYIKKNTAKDVFYFLAHPKYFLRFFYFLPRLLRLVHSQSFINAPP